MNNEERFIEYKNNYNNIWLNHFIWKGLTGLYPQNHISIVNFAKETDVFSNIGKLHNVNDLFNIVTKLSNTYVNWCNTKDNFTKDEKIRIKDFFIGALGEYFFTYVLDELKCMLIPNIKNGKLERYDFKHICPRLLKEQDFGIDLTGMLSYNNKYYPVALQVKFWNPMTDNPITNEIAQKAHSDAICNNFINQNDNKNIVICWLGNTKKVSKYLTLNDKLYEHIIFIDMHVLDNCINDNMPNFWDTFLYKLINIKGLK